jgi:hypothetical protein
MLVFSFQSTIADIDQTIVGEPCHPTTILVIEVGEDFIPVIVPREVLDGRYSLLAVDRTVQISGEVRDSPYGPRHVASTLHIIASSAH